MAESRERNDPIISGESPWPEGNNSPEFQKPNWISKHTPPEVLNGLFVFKISLVSGGTPIVVNMAGDIEIDYERLESQMDVIPAQYAWWAAVYSEGRAMVALLERRIKIRRGELIDACLSVSKSSGIRPTDKQAAMVVEKDEMLNKWEVDLIMMQKNVGKLWHMIKAIEMKSEQLRSRSGFKRQENELHRRA